MALVQSAGRLVGIKELLRAGGLNPGEQTVLKRILRDLVKDGRLERDGKRFGVPGQPHARTSGPAWDSKKPSAVRAKAGVAPGFKKGAAAPQARKARDEAPFGLSRGKGKKPAEQKPAGRPAHGSERPRSGSGPVLMEGIINHHPDGFAFVRALTGKSEDVFIPPDQARKALDHDRVVVEVVPQRGGRTLGRIVEVKRRTRQHVIGVYAEARGAAWVEPREASLGLIDVPKTQLARPGDIVKVRLGVAEKLLRGHEHRLVGEVSGSLGAEADHSVEVLSVAFSRGFHDEFPDEVMDEADAFPLELTEADLRGRRDLRQLPLVTIDGEDARDFDDAIYVEPAGQGWRLVVAIADVSHYVTQGSALDAEALHRATSVYLPGRVLPMLPERLSNGLCSLKPEEDRLCMVADMVIDRTGVTQQTEVYAAVMRSRARCTYTEVHQVLNGEDVPHRAFLKPMLEDAHRLIKALNAMRNARGAIDFDLPETRPELDDQGLPVRLVRRERWESHRLVEECMLAANEAVAREFRKAGRVTVNRYHGEPDADRLSAFLTLLGAYGIAVPKDHKVDSKQLNQILKELDGHPEQKALHQLALRSMMQAVYSSETAGHYGLGALDYLHFTSPIRRYPDLLVHRLLKQWWKTKHELAERELEELESMAQHASERERAAMLVEREVNALYSCLLMKDRVGESFPATVSSLAEHGFFVELDDLFIEGLVKGETLYPQFEFDQATYRINYGNGRVVKVGLKCTVTLVAVNLTRKQMDFAVEGFADEDEVLTPYEARAKKKGGARGGPRGASSRGDDRRGPERGRPNRADLAIRGKRGDAPPARSSQREERAPRALPAKERFVPSTVERPRPPAEAPRTAPASPSGGFDPRAVLDRLWSERGGKPAPAPRERESERSSSSRSDRSDRGGRYDRGGKNDRGGRRR
ncbi:MAG: ribonuclease R [Myxococcus sp.]|nr:ribonuclease R [Myxococcus sp.]